MTSVVYDGLKSLPPGGENRLLIHLDDLRNGLAGDEIKQLAESIWFLNAEMRIATKRSRRKKIQRQLAEVIKAIQPKLASHYGHDRFRLVDRYRDSTEGTAIHFSS